MTLATLRSNILINLGRVGDTSTQAMVDTELNQLLTQVLPRKHIPAFVKVDDTLLCTINQEYLDLPSDFAQMYWIQWRENTTDDWSNFRVLEQDMVGLIDTGEPMYGRVMLQSTGTWRFYMRFIPDKAYKVRLFYYAAETALTDPAHEANLSKAGFDDVLLSGGTYRVALRLKLRDEIAIWGKQFRDYVAELRGWKGNLWGERTEFALRSLYR